MFTVLALRRQRQACEHNDSDVRVYVINSTGAIKTQEKSSDDYKFIILMQLSGYSKSQLKDLLVTKSEENTRSHPEHGRKDSPR